MEPKLYYNCIFINYLGEKLVVTVDCEMTIEELIHTYYKRKEKENLFIDNIEKTYFIYNSQKINYINNHNKLYSLFIFGENQTIYVSRLDYDQSTNDINLIEIIKDNIYTCVYKAKYKGKYVAVKSIKKDQLKEDIKESIVDVEISEEDFKAEISKFNKELTIMQKCHCENSVQIYDYFDKEKEFVIVMELCDNTLFKELCKTKNGFNPNQIKEILLQLNNVFKIMNENNIVHRDIKLHNILVKYLDKEKMKFKILLSDYGVINQLNSMTKRYTTHAGTQIIMAPEILSGNDYNNKCDLWSLGVNIYQLYTKKPPYTGQFESNILKQINTLGQSVLNVIKDEKLKDLLSKLLVKNPEQRISWKEYFEHKFFTSSSITIDNYEDVKILETIKDNIYTCVYKASYKDDLVAVKVIKKEALKENIKENKVIDEITEEDFKEEIDKFHREVSIMKKCHCDNSVEIYGSFDLENEFAIVMELCDNTLFKELAKTKKGFNAKEIKGILLQLNNVFRIMDQNNIVHRDIKLHNILVKYLDNEKTKFKILLSDYGVSNQLSSITTNYKTHAGTQIIMAPEILSGNDYNNKCDLWSLGVNIYQLYTKKPPYTGQFESHILKQINKLGQSVLNVIEDEKLKDLLSKLLVKNPEERMSWKEYFEHDFFK